MYEEQRRNKWPGLVSETALICEQLGIENCNTADMSAWTNKQYRKLIKEKCVVLDEARLREASKGLRKCERVMNESFGRKEYMKQKTVLEVRKQFYTRFGMQPFAGNFKHSKKFQGSEWKCRCGLALEEEAHLTGGNCPVYGDLRADYPDLGSDEQLLGFFTAVLERRGRLEEEG